MDEGKHDSAHLSRSVSIKISALADSYKANKGMLPEPAVTTYVQFIFCSYICFHKK